MRRTLAVLCLSAAALATGCGGADNTNAGNGNATRNGIIETNSNMNPRTNGNSVPSNTAVVTNDNGNDNTAGIKGTNTNARGGNVNRKPN